MLDSLLEENHFVLEKKAEAKAKGRAEGFAQGKIEGAIEVLQQVFVEVVQVRFPHLTELAQEKITAVREPKVLHLLVKQLATVPDEAKARWLLSTLISF